MSRFDPSNAECFVLTYVAGALSAVGHDLKLRVEQFQVEVDEKERRVEARFDPDSLRVEHAMKKGRDASGTLTEGDRKKIHKNIREDVLQPRKHPEIRFVSKRADERAGGYHVEGELTLHGTTRQIAFDVKRANGGYEAEVALHQPDFGIDPYRAAFGGLKVKPDVTVQFRTTSK
ncbi:MAG: YceI family protein [Myxococcota bacterium]